MQEQTKSMRRYYSIAAAAWLVIATLALAACEPQSLPTAQQSAPASTPATATPAAASGTTTSEPALPTSVAVAEVSAPIATQGPNTFIETFDGAPAHPQPWQPANWDVTVHSRDIATWDTLEPMDATHGSDCGAPPATHPITAYADAVFLCRDHLMTAMLAEGYGVIYLTPNQLVDFSNNEAVISWDMSTARSSGRDWVDLWITPYQDNLQFPLEDWLPDLDGEPRNAIHIRMDLANGDTMFSTSIIRNFETIDIPGQNLAVGYESFLTPDAKRRDKFELRISRGHIRFGMPAYNFYWIDTAIPELDWSQGAVQLGHHSYNPAKDAGCPLNQTAQTGCAPTTWHWDNVSINPAAPFTILRANQRVVDAEAAQIRFPAPAPANAYLRFAGIGSQLEISFDSGKTWQPAVQQAQEKSAEEHFSSYWTPIPAGTQSIQFRGDDWWGGSWVARDISIWALDPASSASSK
jgi:hypothetical protein